MAVLFVGCKDYPYHTVREGSTTMIVYKSEKNDKIEYGKYKYAISDASGKGWTFVSNQMYNIGDTIKFVSIDPYRIVVTGRIKHFISAFGEHVIGEEVEAAILEVAREMNVSIVEFTVAPYIAQGEGKSYHEWLVEFERPPLDMDLFTSKLDQAMCVKNVYYQDLITGHILKPLELVVLPKNAFINYMKSEGKLGGQNKVPRLSNDRKIADALHTQLGK